MPATPAALRRRRTRPRRPRDEGRPDPGPDRVGETRGQLAQGQGQEHERDRVGDHHDRRGPGSAGTRRRPSGRRCRPPRSRSRLRAAARRAGSLPAELDLLDHLRRRARGDQGDGRSSVTNELAPTTPALADLPHGGTTHWRRTSSWTPIVTGPFEVNPRQVIGVRGRRSGRPRRRRSSRWRTSRGRDLDQLERRQHRVAMRK